MANSADAIMAGSSHRPGVHAPGYHAVPPAGCFGSGAGWVPSGWHGRPKTRLPGPALIRPAELLACSGDFPKALIWTTSQIVAGGSSFSVTSWFGHVAEVFLQVYMVTVIAAIAGSFASYFTSD
jgi:hypothetical protein